MKKNQTIPELKVDFIHPSYEIIPLPDAHDSMGVLKHLEKVGRTCYKSEDRITNDSCVKFVKMIRDRKHWAMLEHFVFTVEVPECIYGDIRLLSTLCDDQLISTADPDTEYDLEFIELGEKMKYLKLTAERVNKHSTRCLISASATTLNNLLTTKAITRYIHDHRNIFKGLEKSKNHIDVYLSEELEPGSESMDLQLSLLIFIFYVHEMYPELILLPSDVDLPKIPLGSFYQIDTTNELVNCDMFPNGYIFKMLTQEEINKLPVPIREVHQMMSVRFITDRGVSHEIVRHRPVSYAQESTRYCNYSDKGYQVILPWWASEHPQCRPGIVAPEYFQKLVDDINEMLWYMNGKKIGKFRLMAKALKNPIFNPMKESEFGNWLKGVVSSLFYYNAEINFGMKPQGARAVLHHSIKTEIVVTCNMMEWKHFFKMRADEAAHPDMQAIARPLLEEAQRLYPEVFTK